jgi:predicted nucleic acid-binding protein
MPNVVFDASSVIGAALKQDSIPERALLLARSQESICLSPAVESEIREVLQRPKFHNIFRMPSAIGSPTFSELLLWCLSHGIK